MLKSMMGSSLDLNRASFHRHFVDYEDVWFSDPFAGVESARAIVADDGGFESILMVAESVDHEIDHTPSPGIYAEDLSEMEDEINLTLEKVSMPLTMEAPNTPNQSMGAIFTELPSLVSSDVDSDSGRDSPAKTSLEEAFNPPREKTPLRRKPAKLMHPYERDLFHKLTASMRRSKASRREILRRRRAFGNHPALIEFERHEVSQQQVWRFISSRHKKQGGSL